MKLVMNIIIIAALRARTAKPYHLKTGGYGPDVHMYESALTSSHSTLLLALLLSATQETSFMSFPVYDLNSLQGLPVRMQGIVEFATVQQHMQITMATSIRIGICMAH